MIKTAEVVQACSVGSAHHFLLLMIPVLTDQGQHGSMKTSCFKRQNLIGECLTPCGCKVLKRGIMDPTCSGQCFCKLRLPANSGSWDKGLEDSPPSLKEKAILSIPGLLYSRTVRQ